MSAYALFNMFMPKFLVVRHLGSPLADRALKNKGVARFTDVFREAALLLDRDIILGCSRKKKKNLGFTNLATTFHT